MNAIILAAGYGKRLKPLTNKIPKCLVKIRGRVLLNIWLEKLSIIGVDKVLINTHYLADQVEDFIKTSKFQKKVEIVYEKELLGTAGTLNANINFFENKDGILLHADNYCVDDLTSLLQAHKYRPKECLMTMLTFETSNPSTCGIVSLDKRGIVKDFHEKSSQNFGNIANGATYVLSKDFVKIIKEDFNFTKNFSTEIIDNFLGKIYTYHTKSYYTDIGTLEEYESAQRK